MASSKRWELRHQMLGSARTLRFGILTLAFVSCWLTLLILKPKTDALTSRSHHLRSTEATMGRGLGDEVPTASTPMDLSTIDLRLSELKAASEVLSPQLPTISSDAEEHDVASTSPMGIHLTEDADTQTDTPVSDPTVEAMSPMTSVTPVLSDAPVVVMESNVTTVADRTPSTAPPTIPHIIHQSWKNADKIPSRFEPWMRSWLRLNPGWQYVFWTDDNNLDLFRYLYPKYLNVAASVGKIQLADMARYALLYELGGLYVDADFECLQPFTELHAGYQLFLSSEPKAHTVLLEGEVNSLALCNALMASVPRHPFWLKVLDNVLETFLRQGNIGPVSLTGPRIVKATYLQLFSQDKSVSVLPQDYFYPEIAYWNVDTMTRACRQRQDEAAQDACHWLQQHPHGEFTSNTHATHHWQCTWCIGENSATYRRLDQIFSQSRDRVWKPVISIRGVELVET